MVKPYVEDLSSMYRNAWDSFPPLFLIAMGTAYIGEGKYVKAFRMEFVGTLLMIVCTFSAGKWIGTDAVNTAWFSHFIGVIVADKLGGGPHVNPAVTLSMWCLGHASYTEAYVRVAAQMAGGLIAFPLFAFLSDQLNLTRFGGPQFSVASNDEIPVDAFISEFSATFLLMWLIYILNWELNFGTYNYWIKQSLTAVGIRALIEVFPTAGPAMNPMLATTWDVFGVDTTYEFPSGSNHYFVYWLAPAIAAILASVVYALYAGGRVFGVKIPALIKKSAPSAENKSKKE